MFRFFRMTMTAAEVLCGRQAVNEDKTTDSEKQREQVS